MSVNPIQGAVDKQYARAVELRRAIHANPELSGQERQTARLVYTELRQSGIRARYCLNKTGVVGEIANGGGPTVVLRADIDALPVTEINSLPYRSRNKGVMHACGHDMHTAALLGAARALAEMRACWGGRVMFLFQPSEEVEPGGAAPIIEQGFFPEHAAGVFGLHVTADHTTGQVGLKPGDDYSGVLVFDVLVTGRGGHGATPEKTIDPIVCAASMIMELQTLISRESPPFEPAVLTIGSLHAGTKRNVIPDEARFHGTIRTFSDTLQDQLRGRVADSLQAIARAFRAQVDVRIEKSYPSGHNDQELTSRMSTVFKRVLGSHNVIERPHPVMYSEDFAYYQRQAPGLYAHLGVRPKNRRAMPNIHSAHFLPDERALRTAMKLHCGFVLEMCGTSDAPKGSARSGFSRFPHNAP
jgi:amidohydrolase